MVDLSGTWLKFEDMDLVREIHREMLREFGRHALQYVDPPGAPEAREILARMLRRVGFRNHEVMLVNSLTDALNILAKAHLDEGDCIMAESPTRREALIYANCGRPKAAYVQPVWRDPDGYIYSQEELMAIAGEAPLVIYDLTYSLMAAEGLPAPRNSVAIGSLDVLFPGLHMAYIAAPPELFEIYLRFAETSYLCPSGYMNYLFYTAAARGALDKIYNVLKSRERAVRGFIDGAVTPYFAWHKARDKRSFISRGAIDGSEFYRDRRPVEWVRVGLISATEEELVEFFSSLAPEEL